jgi:hypothetical protein
LAIYSIVILTNKNIQLQIANKKVKKKRSRKRIYIGKGDTTNRLNILEEYIKVIIAIEKVIPVISQVKPLVLLRTIRKYSIYRSVEYTTCKYNQR